MTMINTRLCNRSPVAVTGAVARTRQLEALGGDTCSLMEQSDLVRGYLRRPGRKWNDATLGDVCTLTNSEWMRLKYVMAYSRRLVCSVRDATKRRDTDRTYYTDERASLQTKAKLVNVVFGCWLDAWPRTRIIQEETEVGRQLCTDSNVLV